MRKLRLLAWCDSPLSITGFGIVAKNLLGRMHKTDMFDISCVGINHLDEHVEHAFEGRDDVPYKVFIGQDLIPNGPNGSIIPQDRMGRAKTIKMLRQPELGIDVFFMMRDLWDMVFQNAENAPYMSSYFPLHLQLAKESGRNLRVVSHFPLEYKLQNQWGSILDTMDYGYCFTAGGMPQLRPWESKLSWCPQGANADIFKILDNFDQAKFKKEKMHIDPDAFIILNVNRNQPRKDIEATIASYAEFLKKITPGKRRPILWLHMRPDDQFGDVRQLVQKYGLAVDHDVFFPPYFNVGAGWSEEELNMLYNTADVFMSTSVAEGFGLTPVEAGMAGCPVLVPGHTGFLQTVGRLGMPYVKVKSMEMRKHIGPSPITPTDIDDMADQLAKHYSNTKPLEDAVKKNITKFRDNFNWDHIFDKYWVPLLETVREDILTTDNRKEQNKKRFLYVCEEAAGDIIGASKAIAGLKDKYPNTPIDFMCRTRFKNILDGMSQIDTNLDWDINKLFDYPQKRVYYPHAKIRHGAWSNGPYHLMDMQAQMIGVTAGEPWINTKEFDMMLDDMNGKEPETLITIHTSSQGGKMISPQRWNQIILNTLQRFPDIRFIVVGGKGDMMLEGCLDMRGLPWEQQAWLQSKSFCHLGIDSSAGHFAATVGQPSIIFWGWTNPAVCKPQRYSINIVPHYPSVCPRLGPCHGVSPSCGINQYDRDSSMNAPCLQLDVTPAIQVLLEALNKGPTLGREWLKTVSTEHPQDIFGVPSIQHTEDEEHAK